MFSYNFYQVDLLIPTPVAGVITQGRNFGFDQWVETYQVQHSNDGSTWEYIKDSDDNDEVTILNSLKLKHLPFNITL